jgi:AcrR family transcriptional regulator
VRAVASSDGVVSGTLEESARRIWETCVARVENGAAKKADVTRARVLDAASKVFSEKGYSGTRLADIAAVADMQAGSLYYHFASREDLVEAMLKEGQDRTNRAVQARVDSVPPDASHVERLAELIRAHTASVLKIGNYTSATIRIIGQVPEDIRRRRLSDQRTHGRYWQRLLQEAQDAGEIRTDVDLTVVRLIIVGGLNSSTEWFHPGRGLGAEELGDQFATMFLDGLATRRGLTRRIVVPEATFAAKQTNGDRFDEPRRAATRARILDAAAKIFGERGYAGARLTDIAAAAGMRTGSLYYHFESREDLVAELMRLAWERTTSFVHQAVEALPPTASDIDRLYAAMGAHLLSCFETNAYTSSLVRILGQVPEKVRAQSRGNQREYARYWRRLLEGAADAGKIRDDLDLSAMQMMLINALNWTVEWYRPDGRLTPEEIATEFASVVFDGLAVRRNLKGRMRVAAALSQS